ncbi:DUF4871 domain-containing protein [Evansella halocellulosilytica]|uniref:DUF4871 domain-containing protein n=1 Tax=Evansella halocellulosilytica TaxID=2011013 RepID=UPI000BB68FDC|nr:DUF4871 domain-containing protein [Evansella halocellulosilytica]
MVKHIFSTIIVLAFLVGCTDEESSNTKEENDKWERSPTFVSANREMVGIEGKVGLLGGDFVANEESKQMWHFWGDSEFLFENYFIVEATHEDTDIVIDLFRLTPSGPNNGADAHQPSSIELPETGGWKLDVYFYDKHENDPDEKGLFETIVIEVK